MNTTLHQFYSLSSRPCDKWMFYWKHEFCLSSISCCYNNTFLNVRMYSLHAELHNSWLIDSSTVRDVYICLLLIINVVNDIFTKAWEHCPLTLVIVISVVLFCSLQCMYACRYIIVMNQYKVWKQVQGMKVSTRYESKTMTMSSRNVEVCIACLVVCILHKIIVSMTVMLSHRCWH